MSNAVAPGKNHVLVVVILTFNSAASVRDVIESAQHLADRIVVVDSGSKDSTVAIVESLGCEVVEHPFENYAAQRNWAQLYLALDPETWVLHLDSDEILSPELQDSIRNVLEGPPPSVDGFLMQRLSYFMGKPMRYGYINPSWHLRLYRAGKGKCEERLYDQHYIVPGSTTKLEGLLLDMQAVTLEQWTQSHNRWSTAEATEFALSRSEAQHNHAGTLPASLKGDIRMKKRWLKNNVWYKMPLLVRPMLFFFYSYVIRLGFLDGKVGLIYNILQAFWFRFLVDAKIYEQELMEQRQPPIGAAETEGRA
jgi:glycosyltransferase involved in cell wall biosynthesis